jgi:hypothetical protein
MLPHVLLKQALGNYGVSGDIKYDKLYETEEITKVNV